MYLINKTNIFFLTIFIIFKLLIINIIDQNRFMPIEPDDAYYYVAKSNLIYNDPKGVNINQSTQKQIIHDTKEKTKLSSNEIYHIDILDRLTKPNYFLYSKIFGFFYTNYNFDPNRIWWSINYITQILIGLSLFLIFLKFINPKNNLYFVFYFILSFFIMIPAKHQIMSTPMVIGNSLMLIGWYILTNYRKSIIIFFVGFFIFFISLHFHPALFVINFLIFLYHLINFVLNKNVKNFFETLIFFTIPIITLLLEGIFVKVFHLDTYTGLFNMNFEGSNLSNLSLYEIFRYNIKETIYRFSDIIKTLTFIKSWAVNIIIYFISVYITYKFNRNLFYFSIVTLFCIFIGNFHYFPNHKGELIEYTMNFLAIFIFSNIIFSYIVAIEYLENKIKFLNIKSTIIFLIILISFFNIPKILKTVENRINKKNYSYNVDELKNFIEVNTPYKDDAIITNNYITFSLLNSIYFDKIIILADNTYKIHEWRLNRKINIKGFVGSKIPDDLKFRGEFVNNKKIFLLEKLKPIKLFE
jgi:hypothetical protein